MAWIGVYAFAAQIYCDFSGYVDTALGVARIFKIELPDNFNFPYMSRSITELWRRWHITLSSWLKDYLYIPLGGNQHGLVMQYRNLVLTMLLGGLWHGANWTFVVWGASMVCGLVLKNSLVNLLIRQKDHWQHHCLVCNFPYHLPCLGLF